MLRDLLGAFGFLTILPGQAPGERPSRIFAYFPLVGLTIGGILSTINRLLTPHPRIAVFLTLLTWVILTGGLHLDGLGDACDGLLATTSPERRLAIMKDPRAGIWAVAGITLLLLGKQTALAELSPRDLILPPVAGRWAMVLVTSWFPYARSSGLGKYFRDGLTLTEIAIASLTALLTGLLAGWPGGLTVLLAPLIAFLLGSWAAGRLGGGLTGDIYGAVCEVTELACLITLNFL